ncbi:5-formyltetrahydrofolate cyclo-ligase [Gracilimonas mengyeensis]|uniref:5-formyltetrahydrofolate cyclo-ligase n=1 Tax=Gracilimonas mengyeensis TaxID=1302730 RepID=A0A521AIB4_9BACT|nr:5-formyltetrahydrofolate cyclo-ligase [Gracilimonas mengyeensis]SMO34498.1 5-formyltetrahydrofolate cyclo-ligase [Gracilimonas mengyeensis]
MNAVNKRKEELREEVLTRRSKLSEEEWQAKSEKIIQHFFSDDLYDMAKVVHCYVSMNERNEVCTDALITKMLEAGKRVVVPVTNFSNVLLHHIEIDSLDDLKSNKWGIREPDAEEEEEVPVEELDVVIIPMAAADRKGNRLGYGKGFYDRFLAKTNARKIGFVFKEFLFDEIPVEEYDVKLDVIITEDGPLIP